MNVTITAHDLAADGDTESRRFHFLVDDGDSEPRTAFVTLRTARVLVRELANRTGLDAMMRKIVHANADEYDDLVGGQFKDR